MEPTKSETAAIGSWLTSYSAEGRSTQFSIENVVKVSHMTRKVAEAPLNQAEINHWLTTLGSTPEAQASTLKDLLRHAAEDRMSPEDRSLCVRELNRLNLAIPERVRQDIRPRLVSTPTCPGGCGLKKHPGTSCDDAILGIDAVERGRVLDEKFNKKVPHERIS